MRFTIQGMPKGKGRPRKPPTGKLYAPEETVVYEVWVRQCAVEAMDGKEPLEGPIALNLDIYLPIPKSWSKRRQGDARAGAIRPAIRPDMSNVSKAVEDGLQGIVFADDKQIVEGLTTKRYGVVPRVEVEVEEL